MYDLIGVTNKSIKELRWTCSLSDDETMKLQYIWDSRNRLNIFTVVEVAKDESSDTQNFKVGVVMNESVCHISELLNRIKLGSNVREDDFVTIPRTSKDGAGMLIRNLFQTLKPEDNNEDINTLDAACRYISF